MGPPGAGQGAPRSARLSSPAPTRHLSPALPAHTPRTPAAPGALPPPTLRLPPLPEGADARASPAGAAPASQSVSAWLGIRGPGIPAWLALSPSTFTLWPETHLWWAQPDPPTPFSAAPLSIPESEKKTFLTRLLPRSA